MPMQFIDTHAHLYLEQFKADRDQVVSNAIEKGVLKIFLPNIDSSSIEPMNQVVKAYAGICHAMMGMHPRSVKENYHDEFEMIREELLSGEYIAIGEIGIDLYWDKTHLREQSLVFEQELDLALKLDKPVVIHARESFDVIFEILQQYKNKGIRGVFHAFSGTPEQADQVIENGLLMGIGGMVTYRNPGLVRTVQETNLQYFVLETDSPFLPPVPNRGKRNEPAFLTFIAETIARLKTVDITEVASTTTANALELFRINNQDEQ
ncbi:MAG: TatD family hydrolase [Bacteroidales bacterium]|nr:TatD family hydrolase [Bacteroidales bacterium]